KRYVDVLQAVGNSIMTQVDERRHKENWDRARAAKGEREVSAMQSLLPTDAKSVLTYVSQSLDAEQQGAAMNAADAGAAASEATALAQKLQNKANKAFLKVFEAACVSADLGNSESIDDAISKIGDKAKAAADENDAAKA